MSALFWVWCERREYVSTGTLVFFCTTTGGLGPRMRSTGFLVSSSPVLFSLHTFIASLTTAFAFQLVRANKHSTKSISPHHSVNIRSKPPPRLPAHPASRRPRPSGSSSVARSCPSLDGRRGLRVDDAIHNHSRVPSLTNIASNCKTRYYRSLVSLAGREER